MTYSNQATPSSLAQQFRPPLAQQQAKTHNICSPVESSVVCPISTNNTAVVALSSTPQKTTLLPQLSQVPTSFFQHQQSSQPTVFKETHEQLQSSNFHPPRPKLLGKQSQPLAEDSRFNLSTKVMTSMPQHQLRNVPVVDAVQLQRRLQQQQMFQQALITQQSLQRDTSTNHNTMQHPHHSVTPSAPSASLPSSGQATPLHHANLQPSASPSFLRSPMPIQRLPGDPSIQPSSQSSLVGQQQQRLQVLQPALQPALQQGTSAAQLMSQRSQREQQPFQSKFGPSPLTLTINRLRELQSRSKINQPIANENECAERLLVFLSSWIGRLWQAAIETSFKRVDCPAAPFESQIVDDLSYQAELEQLKAQHEAEAARHKQLAKQSQPVGEEEPEGASTSTSMAPNKKKGGRKRDSGPDKANAMAIDDDIDIDEDAFMNDSGTTFRQKKVEDKKSAAEPPPISGEPSSSVDALKDLGLEDSLFAGLDDEEKESKTWNKGKKATALLSDLAYKRKNAAEAEAKVRAENAVRRKQAKLTREVTIDDLLTVLKDEQKFPLPKSVRKEFVRVLNFMTKVSGSSAGTFSLSNRDVSLTGYRLFGHNTYLPKHCSSSTIPLYLTDGAAPVIFPVSIDGRSPRIKDRFTNTWTSLSSSGGSGAPAAIESRARNKRTEESMSSSATRESASEKVRSKRKRQSSSRDSSVLDDGLSGLSLPFVTAGSQALTPFNMINMINPSSPQMYFTPYNIPGATFHPGVSAMSPMLQTLERPPQMTMPGMPY